MERLFRYLACVAYSLAIGACFFNFMVGYPFGFIALTCIFTGIGVLAGLIFSLWE